MPNANFPWLRALLLPCSLLLPMACASANAGTGPTPPSGGAANATASASAPATPNGKPVGPAGLTKVTTVEGITEYRLGNGMRVLLYPDQSKATVTVNVTYFVGSRHEGYGESGMAHLLEHMLFKGTPTRNDVMKLLHDRGAQFNGSTWFDRTNYFEELSATPDNLDFAIRLEADRMVNSSIAPEALAKEFSVVRNEFEMGENDPGSVLEEKIFATAYQWHNYGKATIGSRSDIERVPADNLRAFYRRFYQPDNAMLVVAGKFDEAQVLGLVGSTFGALPRPTRTLNTTWTEEPVQDGERNVILRRNGDIAVVAAAYHGVAGGDPDWLALDAVSDVLSNKPAGRLYKALVEKGLASSVFGTVYPTAEPGLIYVGAKVRPGGSPEKVRDALLKITEGLATAPITDAEVQRWRARSQREFDLALTNTAEIGVALSDWAAMGDWRLFFLTRERLKSVKVEDVNRVAKNLLKTSNRTAGMFLPTKDAERSPAPPRIDVAAVMKDFKGGAAVSEGETFLATIENVEKRTTRTALPGGLKLAMLPKKTKGGSVQVEMVVRYGSEKDLTGKTAAAEIVSRMLMRGTKKHSFQQLKDEFDRLKAEVNIGGGASRAPQPGVSLARIKTVRENLPAVLTLVAEVLREPAFPKAEFEPLRKEALAQLEEQLQDPMSAGFKTLLRNIAPMDKTDVRYNATAKEKIEQLKALQVGEVAQVHKSMWGASAAQVAIVGDFDPKETQALLTKELDKWKSPKPYERVDQPFKEGKAEAAEVNTPDKQMALVAVGHPLQMRDDDPDYPTLVMLNQILGSSASSRLWTRLRQKEGISYSAFSTMSARALDKSGVFFAGAICAPQNADKAMAALLEEIDLLLKSGVPEKELDLAKKSYAASWATDLADDAFVADELTQGLFLARNFDHWKKVNDRIQTLTPADIQTLARKVIQPAKLTKVKAGDLTKKSS
jgi:zinc protease